MGGEEEGRIKGKSLGIVGGGGGGGKDQGEEPWNCGGGEEEEGRIKGQNTE